MSDANEWNDDDEAAYAAERAEYSGAYVTLREKVRAMLGTALDDKTFALGTAGRLHEVAQRIYPDVPENVLHDIIFHLTDWREDAACLLALASHPDQFTPMEIRVGLSAFLVHAPNHVAAAAKLSGHTIQDTFKLGALVQGPDDDEPFVM